MWGRKFGFKETLKKPFLDLNGFRLENDHKSNWSGKKASLGIFMTVVILFFLSFRSKTSSAQPPAHSLSVKVRIKLFSPVSVMYVYPFRSALSSTFLSV